MIVRFSFQLKVLPRDVQLCADVTTGVDSLGQFQYQDLVMLDQQTAGVIVRLEKEYLEVLNMHGKVTHLCHFPIFFHLIDFLAIFRALN